MNPTVVTQASGLCSTMPCPQPPSTGRLTLIGGRDKHGHPEYPRLELHPGEVVCIVGPTGSGKSRLLADIECLAQGDTPTGRQVLVDGRPPDPAERFEAGYKRVAQLSQNMNFVVDMTAQALIALHARCRQIEAVAERVAAVLACANTLAGESFGPDTPVTQLSGGQTRALMIADVALLSRALVVLIDEIENAGVDRRRALALLTGGQKIVLVSTHDPLLALQGQRRIVIRHGGMAEVLDTSASERMLLGQLEVQDRWLGGLRDRLRGGARLEAPDSWTHR